MGRGGGGGGGIKWTENIVNFATVAAESGGQVAGVYFENKERERRALELREVTRGLN